MKYCVAPVPISARDALTVSSRCQQSAGSSWSRGGSEAAAAADARSRTSSHQETEMLGQMERQQRMRIRKVSSTKSTGEIMSKHQLPSVNCVQLRANG